MSIRQQTATSLFWTVLQNGGRRLISLSVFLILARLLVPEDFGLIALAGAMIAFIEFTMRLGFVEAIIQRRDVESGHLDTAFWISFGMGSALTLLLVMAAGFVASLFGNAELAPVLRWLSISIVVVSLTNIQIAILSRNFHFKQLAIRTLIGSIIGGVVGVVMALQGYGVWALVAQQLTDAVIGLVVLWLSSNWRPGLNVTYAHFRDLFGFGVNVIGAQFMHLVDQHADRLIVGYFLGPSILGYYTVAYRLIEILDQVLGKTFVNVLYITFSRLQDDFDRLKAAFISCTRLITLIVFPVYLFIMLAGPEIVHVVFGNKWASSSNVLQFFAASAFVRSITVFHDSVFRAVGKPVLAFRVSVVKTILGVVLILLVVTMGIEAVALTTLLVAVVITLYSSYLINGVFVMGCGIVVKQIRASLIACLVMASVILLLLSFSEAWGESITGLATIGLLSAISYAVTLCVIDAKLMSEAWATMKIILRVR